MTELLQRAISAIEQLPDDVQDAIAARLLSEVEDERAWSEQFGATTDAQWNHLAEMVRRDLDAGRTSPLDDEFPPVPRP